MFKDLQKRGKCTFGRFVMEISTAEMLPDRNLSRIRKKPETIGSGLTESEKKPKLL